MALAATIGNPNDFKNGRHFSAFIGLVPKQWINDLWIVENTNPQLKNTLLIIERAEANNAKDKAEWEESKEERSKMMEQIIEGIAEIRSD